MKVAGRISPSGAGGEMIYVIINKGRGGYCDYVAAVLASTNEAAEAVVLAVTGLAADHSRGARGWRRSLEGCNPLEIELPGEFILRVYRPMDSKGYYPVPREKDIPAGIPVYREGEALPPIPPLPEEMVVECENGYALHIRFTEAFRLLGEEEEAYFSVEYYFTGNEEKFEISEFFSSSSMDRGLPRERSPKEMGMLSLHALEKRVGELKKAAANVEYLDVRPMKDVLPKDITFASSFNKELLNGRDDWGEVRDGLTFDSPGSLESTVIGWTKESILVLLTYEEYRDWDCTDTIQVLVKYPRNPS
ncbi:MAG: hypothetical protein HGA38_03325 [Candidatus Moranbacteria bacterium]|nr:hypothetical protein [Candidatus Moranbacteria bacterium]